MELASVTTFSKDSISGLGGGLQSHLGSVVAVSPLLLVHDVHYLGVVRSVLHDVKQQFCPRLLVASNLYSLLPHTSRPEDSSEEDDQHQQLDQRAVPVRGVGGDGGEDGLEDGDNQDQAEEGEAEERRPPEVEGFEEIIAEREDEIEPGVESEVEGNETLEYIEVNISDTEVRLIN